MQTEIKTWPLSKFSCFFHTFWPFRRPCVAHVSSNVASWCWKDSYLTQNFYYFSAHMSDFTEWNLLPKDVKLNTWADKSPRQSYFINKQLKKKCNVNSIKKM